MLDAGVQLSKVNNKVNLNYVDFAFISHEHQDHSKYSYALEVRGVKVYKGESFLWKIARGDGYYLTSFDVSHGECPCYGCIVKTSEECILYVTDFSLCKWDLESFKFTHIIVECNYQESRVDADMIRNNPKYHRQINTHMGLDGLHTFLSHLDMSNVKELIICHKSTDNLLFNEDEVVSSLYAIYHSAVGCCNHAGGINWIGKEEF